MASNSPELKRGLCWLVSRLSPAEEMWIVQVMLAGRGGNGLPSGGDLVSVRFCEGGPTGGQPSPPGDVLPQDIMKSRR